VNCHWNDTWFSGVLAVVVLVKLTSLGKVWVQMTELVGVKLASGASNTLMALKVSLSEQPAALLMVKVTGKEPADGKLMDGLHWFEVVNPKSQLQLKPPTQLVEVLVKLTLGLVMQTPVLLGLKAAFKRCTVIKSSRRSVSAQPATFGTRTINCGSYRPQF